MRVCNWVGDRSDPEGSQVGRGAVKIYRKGEKNMKNRFALVVASVGAILGVAGNAFAEFTVPSLPVTDLESAGVAVAGLVAAYVVIRMAIRMIKGA